MKKPAIPDQPPKRRRRGFEAAGTLVGTRIRKAGEQRGFALTRLLTQWPEIAGAEMAALATPVDIKYGREGGLGAALTLLVKGANAPLVEMQKPALLERVNRCYGYAAISRIRITQTAATGFGEAKSPFGHRTASTGTANAAGRQPDATTQKAAHDLAQEVSDPGLKAALERLGGHVLSRKTPPGT